MAENVLGGLLGYSNALKRRIRGLLNDPVNFLESAIYDVIPRPEEAAAVDPRNLSATPFDSPYVQKTLQMGGLLGPVKRIYRAHAGDDLAKIKAFTSWAEDEETARAYTVKGIGHGGPNVRAVDVDVSNVLDITGNNQLLRLARALGHEDPYQIADDWRMSGYRYPWEENRKVADSLRNSEFDWLRYEDDYPDGAITLLPLRNFVPLNALEILLNR